MVTHSNTYCRLLPLKLCRNHSSLARLDTASIAITHSPLFEWMISPTRSAGLKPAGADMAMRIGKWKIKLCDPNLSRIPFMHCLSIVAHYELKSIVITDSSQYELRWHPPWSMIFRPPRIDLVGSITIGKSLSGNESDRSVHVFSGRSLLPRSQMKEISIVRGSPPRSKIFRPPRIDLIGSTAIGKSLSGNERDRSVHVFSGRSLLSRFLMKEISIVRGSPPRRVVIKPPRQECGTMIHTRRYALLKNRHGCTPPIPECRFLTRMETGGMFFRKPSHSWEILHSPPLQWNTLSVRIMNGKAIAARYEQRRSAAV
jgi:hypothetical protein